jgi:serine phosphatase RsbU (regulator of sigma subunit)
MEIIADASDDANAAEADLEVLQAVIHTNRYVASNHGDLGMFATLFFGVLDIQTGRLAYINAGHDPLFLLHPQGGVQDQLDATGPAVGISANAMFTVRHATIRPGETLFSYTDGIPEATSDTGEFFGRQRLTKLLEESTKSAADLVTTIADAVSAHTGEAEQFDDITILAVRRNG